MLPDEDLDHEVTITHLLKVVSDINNKRPHVSSVQDFLSAVCFAKVLKPQTEDDKKSHINMVRACKTMKEIPLKQAFSGEDKEKTQEAPALFKAVVESNQAPAEQGGEE